MLWYMFRSWLSRLLRVTISWIWMPVILVLMVSVNRKQEHVIAYCSHSLWPSQHSYSTTKRKMLDIWVQIHSYCMGVWFTLCTHLRPMVWLHRLKEAEWLMFNFTTVHCLSKDHGKADGLSMIVLHHVLMLAWSATCGPDLHRQRINPLTIIIHI